MNDTIDDIDVKTGGDVKPLPRAMTPDDARHTLAVERESRERECLASLQELLAKYRCAVRTTQAWVNGVPSGPAQIQVVAQD
ncbi:MAG TPA: hypothetical protein VF526_15340 [Solirubrobacteraceae bacterium]|jgi:hypothetical protein